MLALSSQGIFDDRVHFWLKKCMTWQCLSFKRAVIVTPGHADCFVHIRDADIAQNAKSHGPIRHCTSLVGQGSSPVTATGNIEVNSYF